MTAVEETRGLQTIDATFHYGAIVLRACGYLAVFAIARNYDCGRAILTGVLAGDMVGQLVKIGMLWRDNPLVQFGELLLLGIIYLLVQDMIAWPQDTAMRAIVGLAGFGMLTGHIGGSMLTQLGPSPN
ncbi:MAG: hypothetical protein KDC98_20655 [Planctomycetes bacterium]|nr:hypothetical protein [Planctomycetota bacterium]